MVRKSVQHSRHLTSCVHNSKRAHSTVRYWPIAAAAIDVVSGCEASVTRPHQTRLTAAYIIAGNIMTQLSASDPRGVRMAEATANRRRLKSLDDQGRPSDHSRPSVSSV